MCKQRAHLPFLGNNARYFSRLLHQSSPIRAIGRNRIVFLGPLPNSSFSIARKAWTGEVQAPWRTARNHVRVGCSYFELCWIFIIAWRDVSPIDFTRSTAKRPNSVWLTLVTPAPSLDAMNRSFDHHFAINWVNIHGLSFPSICTENKPIVPSRSLYTIWMRGQLSCESSIDI